MFCSDCSLILVVVQLFSAKAFYVELGGLSTCIIDMNKIMCYGWNHLGQLGLGHTEAVYEPRDTAIDLGDDFLPSTVSCGKTHCCSVSGVGTLKCFGSNGYGELGYGDTDNRGDAPNQMGNNLPLVNLGTGFIVDHVSTYNQYTCAMSTTQELKCFGSNNCGQLGYGDLNNRGGESGQMGDDLEYVELGDFDAIKLIDGRGNHVCALSSDGAVKCFGKNNYGQLGQGDTNNRGDNTGEMGNNLLPIDFGTTFVASVVKCGDYHCCALSTERNLKCFGMGSGGRLGYEDTTRRGDGSGKMGDSLPAVGLGTNFIVEDFVAGGWSTCVISTEGEIKCFGGNSFGGLGYGDTVYRGDSSGSMGDALPIVDVGSGFTATGIRLADGGSYHFCVYEESESSENLLKCWGKGGNYQLGYGDTDNRGDGSGEMGDSLPFVDIGAWAMSSVPTTAAPSSVPTTSPSVSPTDPVCDAANMTSVNWHDLLNSGEQDVSLLQSYAVDFDASTLSLTFSASVEYVGRSADGNFDDDFNLGTSYWIDFQAFSSIDGGIDSVGNCANRRSTDYLDLSFGQFWNYTVNPMELELVSTAERTAYPASDWNLTASSCNAVEFERTFSWTELTGCLDAEDNELIEVTETADTVQLEGTFFVELVSPYSMSSDEYYRTYPLLQQDFSIVLNRQVDALASSGVQLFISSVMAYGRDDEGNYEVTILVQSADYVMLGMDDSVTAISSPLAVSNIETVSADCLVASSFTCGQIFTATVPATCSADDTAIDLSGTYQFGFTPQCQIVDGSTDEACTTFLSTLDSDGKVVLDVDSSFTDNCDVDLFSVTFDADLTFYEDDAFTVEASDPFVIGQDTIYGKVVVDTPSDPSGEMYQFVEVSIENVYVCTAADTADLSLDDDSGLGGCLSEYIDDDGPYNVIGTGAVSAYQGTTYTASGSEATFSFLTFDTARTTINVHVQLLLTVVTESGEVGRRRMLLQSGSDGDDVTGNAFRSFIGTASVAEEETTADPVGTDGGVSFSVGWMPAMFAFTALIMG